LLNFILDKIELKKSLTNRNPFEQGQSDTFEINSPEVGEIKKIRIGHDGLGAFAGKLTLNYSFLKFK
jgi:hypothetical protein